MRSFLTLDLGQKTGWALHKNKRVFSGVYDLGKGRGDQFEGGGIRFLRLHKFLAASHEKHGFDVIYFEEVRNHAGVAASHAYGGYLAVVTAWCEENLIAYQGVPVGTIKKDATGKGNAGKQMMIDAMSKKGHNVIDDNHADALSILYWAVKNGV